MTSVKSVNFYDLCRICTATTEQKIDIFSAEGKTKNLCSKISECLPLNVDEKDRLPKVLCQQCIQHLEAYSEFRIICRNSQIMLTSCLNTASAQNGGKVLIKDVLSSTGKSLSVLNNASNPISVLNTANNAEQLQNASTQSINQSLTTQLQPQQQQTQQQQQMFTIQGSNVIAQSVVNPLTISAAGTLQNQEFLNSIMQAVGIQSDNIKVEKPQTLPQYTITVDNTVQQQIPLQINSQPATPNKEKDIKNNSLDEFLKMKPNIKTTPTNKRQQPQQIQQQQLQQQQQQQVQQQHQEQQQQQIQQQQQQELQQHQLQQQQEQHQQQQHQQQQQQLVQFQLQQLLQQQLQQQQLQQQLQLLTSQLQPQQITITAPTLQQQQQPLAQPLHLLQSSSLATDNSLNDSNDDLSPSKNKKPKLNFVLTPPNHATTLPQLTTVATTPNTNQTQQQPTTPQIQLQFQPTLTQQTTLQLQQQQQQNQNAATAALLSNLAPLLQPQSQLNAALQTQALANVTQNTGANMLSPNKCFLPITIKDENTDQQFVAHIDAKNFLLPTTYQLQMKLQPQLATADGQPIMQLAPTSIPATLQFAPQALNSNQTFQAAAAVTAFNNNSTFPTQLIQQQQHQTQIQQQQHQTQIQQQQQTQIQNQQQTTQIQQQVLPQTTNTQVHQQTQQQPAHPPPPQTQQQSQPTQITTTPALPKNVLVTSQQVLTTGNKKPKTSTTTNTTEISTPNETEKQLPKITATVAQGGSGAGDIKRIIKQQKYKITQQPGSNTIEITPTTSFTQQIMQQVQQQQQQKQKLNQQQSSADPITTTTVTTQHGGITVQRITTKINPTTSTTSTGHVAKDTVTHSTRQATITPLVQQPQQQQQTVTLPKLPMLNKQNITISRITPQTQLQHSKPKPQQQASQIGNTTVKVVQQQIKSQISTTPLQISTASGQQQKQQTLPTRTIPQQQQQQQQQQQLKLPSQQQQQSQIVSNIPNTTLRISPVKKFIKRPPQKSIESSQTRTLSTNTSQQRQTANTQNITTTTAAAAPTTQVHYVTDITSILPTTNENTAPSSDNNVPTMTTQSTATDSNNTTNTDNSDKAKNSLECSQCGRVFKKKEHLTQHVKLHSGIRPFKCNEDGCTKAFHRKEHLLRHLVSHTGKKMFSCDICQKPFSRKDNLSKHRKIHMDPNPNHYVCEFCNKVFAVKAYYDQHKLLHQTKALSEEDIQSENETTTNATDQSTDNSNNNTNSNQIEYQTQPQQHQQQKTVTTTQQQQTTQQRQLELVQQQLQQLQRQNQAQTQQIMHLQLPNSIVTTQDMAGNTITITQANDPQANGNTNALKSLTLSGSTGISNAVGENHHDATVLNLPTSLANFVQLSQAQFVNATTGQIMGHLKIEK